LPVFAGDLERMTSLLLETLHASGYIEAQSAESKEESIRRMTHRLHLSAADATLWLGMLRQILRKLRSSGQ
jgi:tRNA/rRNA methyltransferase